MPTIIRFLGYNPLPAANTLAEQLVASGPAAWGFRRRSRPEKLAWTRARWHVGSAARESPPVRS
jgi:hypothetical protein